jgi:hypothetical protein
MDAITATVSSCEHKVLAFTSPVSATVSVIHHKQQLNNLHTKERWLVPVAIAHLDVISAAIITVIDVHFSNVEHNTFTMCSCDTPLTAFTLSWWTRIWMWWRWKCGRIILVCSPTTWSQQKQEVYQLLYFNNTLKYEQMAQLQSLSF